MQRPLEGVAERAVDLAVVRPQVQARVDVPAPDRLVARERRDGPEGSRLRPQPLAERGESVGEAVAGLASVPFLAGRDQFGERGEGV